jgi:hypothetical protein
LWCALGRAFDENRIMLLSGVILLILACLIIVYYAVAIPVEKSFGERYVTTEIPLIFPFYAIMSFKPVTVFAYLTFAGVVLVLEANKDHLRGLTTRAARILLLVVAFASGYEVIWNFFAWFTSWEKNGGALDFIPNITHQYVALPANFNFATKITFLVFVLSLYGWFFLQNIENSTSVRH